MNGRVALVTGGGRGIGREAALLLSAAGARVMVVSRSASELAAVGLDYVAADLGTAAGCAAAVAETERRLGPIDMLVVNHGIGSAHEKLVWEQDPEVWRETMRINLDGPFELARLTVGGMCKRGFGRLVFTSSTAGEKAERSGSAYTASKHGVIGLARAVAQDAVPFGVTLELRYCRVGCERRWRSARPSRTPNGAASASSRCGRSGRRSTRKSVYWSRARLRR